VAYWIIPQGVLPSLKLSFRLAPLFGARGWVGVHGSGECGAGHGAHKTSTSNTWYHRHYYYFAILAPLSELEEGRAAMDESLVQVNTSNQEPLLFRFGVVLGSRERSGLTGSDSPACPYPLCLSICVCSLKHMLLGTRNREKSALKRRYPWGPCFCGVRPQVWEALVHRPVPTICHLSVLSLLAFDQHLHLSQHTSPSATAWLVCVWLCCVASVARCAARGAAAKHLSLRRNGNGGAAGLIIISLFACIVPSGAPQR